MVGAAFDCDVLIVGAGPTGLMLAIELARRGVQCRLIDGAEGPFTGSRGKGLQPRTLEIFDHIGIAQAVAAQASFYPPMRAHLGPFSFGMAALGSSEPATPELPWPNLLMLLQAQTEAALRSKLADLGVTPQYGARLEGFSQDEAGVTAQLASGAGVRARYLVGCDGGRSTVRKTLGIALIGETLDGREKVVADLEIPGLDRSVWHNWPTLVGVIAIAPLPGGTLFQVQAPARIDADGALGGLSSATGYSPGPIVWKSRFRHQARMAAQWRQGRVLLAGDAAHVHPPSGGQGLNTSIQDAWNLGWKLAAVLNGADDALLDSYAAERMGIAAGMLKLTEKLHKSASSKRGTLTNQLGLGYGGSVLNAGQPLGGIAPGDRMPNLALADGRRVFDALQSGQALKLSGFHGISLFVRPDGYVAAVGAAPAALLAGIPTIDQTLAEVQT